MKSINERWLKDYERNLKMDSREIYKDGEGGVFLKVADLKKDDGSFARLTVTIESVEPNEYQGRKQLVLKFVGKEKKLGLNPTRWKTMAAMFGPETNDWVGKEIKIYVDPTVTNPEGAVVGGVRIQYDPPGEVDDDIPF